MLITGMSCGKEGRATYTFLGADFVAPCGGVGIFDILKMDCGLPVPELGPFQRERTRIRFVQVLFKFCSSLYRFVQDKKIPGEIFALRLGGFAVFAFKSGWRNLWFGLSIPRKGGHSSQKGLISHISHLFLKNKIREIVHLAPLRLRAFAFKTSADLRNPWFDHRAPGKERVLVKNARNSTYST